MLLHVETKLVNIPTQCFENHWDGRYIRQKRRSACIWHAVLAFTVEIVRIFVTIKRATASGSLHCCCSWKIRTVSISSTIEGRLSFIIIIVVCHRKHLISVSSFACWNCPLHQTCLACAYTLSIYFHWYVALVFTVELVCVFVTINRATSGLTKCRAVSVSSSI